MFNVDSTKLAKQGGCFLTEDKRLQVRTPKPLVAGWNSLLEGSSFFKGRLCLFAGG